MMVGRTRGGRILRQVSNASVPVRRGVEYPLSDALVRRGPFSARRSPPTQQSRGSTSGQAGDFLYNRLFRVEGSFGVGSRASRRVYVSGEFPVFRPSPNFALTEYINLVMCRPYRRVRRSCATVDRVHDNQQKPMEREPFSWSGRFPLPPLAEQRRIVDLSGGHSIAESPSRADHMKRQRPLGPGLVRAVRGKDRSRPDCSSGWHRDVVGGICTKDEKRQQGDGLIEVPYLPSGQRSAWLP